MHTAKRARAAPRALKAPADAEASELPKLEAQLGDRITYQDAIGVGQGIPATLARPRRARS